MPSQPHELRQQADVCNGLPIAHFGDREHPDRSMLNAQIGAS
jgi:hypothetical protein